MARIRYLAVLSREPVALANSPRQEQTISSALSLKNSPSVHDFMQHFGVTDSLPEQEG